MKVISDMDDASYFEKRAIELIHESESARLAGTAASYNTYHSCMNKAIQLIVLARIIED